MLEKDKKVLSLSKLPDPVCFAHFIYRLVPKEIYVRERFRSANLQASWAKIPRIGLIQIIENHLFFSLIS